MCFGGGGESNKKFLLEMFSCGIIDVGNIPIKHILYSVIITVAFNNLWSGLFLGFSLWGGFMHLPSGQMFQSGFYTDLNQHQAHPDVQSIHASSHLSITAFSPYPHPCFHLPYPIITALLLSGELWGGLGRSLESGRKGPLSKTMAHVQEDICYITA